MMNHTGGGIDGWTVVGIMVVVLLVVVIFKRSIKQFGDRRCYEGNGLA
jgi:hypothetical protein